MQSLNIFLLTISRVANVEMYLYMYPFKLCQILYNIMIKVK